MKIEYICHACLLIDTGDLKIATDPWFAGPAYCEQWHVFPKPVNAGALDAADVILLTHGHEDHLHPPTLEKLPKRARVLYPYNWYGGTREYIESFGFEDVREAVTYKTYRLTARTAVTFIANNLDSIVVIESDESVFVNVNDALHSYPGRVIDFFTRSIRQRWPHIDTVFCGFGGASYFPNCVHTEGKDDREIGLLREQLFAHNFCRIIDGLAPRRAVPFAADFALLSPAQKWINEIRFPRSRMRRYYEEHFARAGGVQTQVIDMYPGDLLEDGELRALSPYREHLRDGDLTHLIDTQYAEEIGRLEQPTRFISEEDAGRLVEEIRENVQHRASLFDEATLSQLKFSVRLTDVSVNNCYNVSFDGVGAAQVRRTSEREANAVLSIEISSRILRHSFASEWGGDAISIGYGCEIQVFDQRAVEAKLDTASVRLLTRHPTASATMKREPLRGVKYLMRNPLMRATALSRVTGRREAEENVVYDQSMWLLRDKCDVCRICDLPLLDAEFASKM